MLCRARAERARRYPYNFISHEEEEEEEEEDECGVAEENIDFRRTDPERKDRKRRQTAAKRMGDCNCGNVTLLVVGADKG